MNLSRRSFLGVTLSSFALTKTISLYGNDIARDTRKYHVSVSIEALEHEPELFEIFQKAGVSAVWLSGFLYGHWYYKPETIQLWKQKFESAGIPAYVINVPFGHPGDSLGSYSGTVPLTPPTHWKLGMNYDGKTFAGTSLHSPATEENVQALEVLKGHRIEKVFLDDDFRLARSPGVIGGCFCEEHKSNFLAKYGHNPSEWENLIDSIQKRSLTKVLRDWVEFTCDELTNCFRTLESRVPDIELGIMVMYMGSEKAGIRLTDYRNRLFRVGELMFDDRSFGNVKGKCNELFSALFHRRFTTPEKSFSETTAFPADQLSAKNMSAKLVISTISDVRNTMFMSGFQHFPKTHWDILPDAMKKQAQFHSEIASHTPKGPLKHFWGEHSRYVSNDNPYSLFLAMGIPFEVIEKPVDEGWIFVGDNDTENLKPYGSIYITREKKEGCLNIPENLESLYKFKNSIIHEIKNVPFIIEEKPIVCAWYPAIKKVLVWNLAENKEGFTLTRNDQKLSFTLDGLDSILLSDLS